MKAAKYGRIINIISTSVKQPIPGLGVSNTIRGAVASWAKTLSAELGPFGITVNNVLPGYTSTERLGSLISGRAKKQNTTEQKVAEDMRATIPAGRFADPSEIAAAIAFLASPAASYINGINLPVDGGRLGTL
jgi:3-oxoacyl-[acyl-carrier protein] reductase